MLLRSLCLLCPLLVWNTICAKAFLGSSIAGFDHSTTIQRPTRPSTHLHPHRFNGGYDPASPLTWSPHQAAEFVIFHEGSPAHAGMQLRTAIQHWTGADLAEFLTRLYLGRTEIEDTENGKQKIVYELQNVRSPQWKGLQTREGIFALKDLLREGLSKESLSAREVSRFAEAFLLKDYRWPAGIEDLKSKSSANSDVTIPKELVWEQHSFNSLGHSRTLARVLTSVRKERQIDQFDANQIGMMVTLPEQNNEDCEATPFRLMEFFRTIVAYNTQLNEMDKASIVQKMAVSGWSPGIIPRFMSELAPEENRAIDEMCRLQEDPFLDFPTVAAVEAERNARKEKKMNPVALALAKDDFQGMKGDAKEKSKQEKGKSEFDELVQSYWKNVEVTTLTKPKKKIVQAYGVPKTKAVKQRKIPENVFGVFEPKGADDNMKPKPTIVKSKSKIAVEKAQDSEIDSIMTKNLVEPISKYVVEKSEDSGTKKSIAENTDMDSKSKSDGGKTIDSKTKIVEKTKDVVNTKSKSVVESV